MFAVYFATSYEEVAPLRRKSRNMTWQSFTLEVLKSSQQISSIISKSGHNNVSRLLLDPDDDLEVSTTVKRLSASESVTKEFQKD